MKVLQKGTSYYKISTELDLCTCTLSLRNFALSLKAACSRALGRGLARIDCTQRGKGLQALSSSPCSWNSSLTGNHNLVFGHVFCTLRGHQLQQGGLCYPLLASAAINLQPQTVAAHCLLFLLGRKAVLVAHFPGKLAEEWGVGCVAALLLDAGFLLTCYLCCGLVRARPRNCTLLNITAGDRFLGATSGEWYPLVSMQAALVALTLFFHLVLSHVHTDNVPIHTVFLPILIFLLHICTVRPQSSPPLLSLVASSRVIICVGFLSWECCACAEVWSGWEMSALVLSAHKALQQQWCSWVGIQRGQRGTR